MAVYLEPIPFRPDAGTQKMLDVLTERWGLSRSAAMRKLVREGFEINRGRGPAGRDEKKTAEI